jgi:hypothetical protein
MGPSEHDLEHPKKRRRREVERHPLAARLLFDDTVKGNAAIVSQSLWSRLVPADGIRVPNSLSCLMLTLNSIYRCCFTGSPGIPGHYPLVASARRDTRVHMDTPHSAAAAVARLDGSSPATRSHQDFSLCLCLSVYPEDLYYH